MENVHLAVEEDDIYSGYNDYNPTFDNEELDKDAGFQEAVRTSHGRRPPMTAKFPGTAAGGRPLPSSLGDGATRPMSAVRAAGFTSSRARGSSFDPLGQSRGPAPALEEKREDLPEEKIKLLEKKVNDLITESCMAQSTGNSQLVRVTSHLKKNKNKHHIQTDGILVLLLFYRLLRKPKRLRGRRDS
uniref:Intraflagellar transport 88 homolog n=1 Tax=Hippocampus comes TaxID=109280 RepID=A0A3Q2Z5A2_HIPCM